MSVVALRKPKGGEHKPRGRGGALKLDRSYNFVEKRPVIDEMRTLVDHATYKKVANDSTVSISTLRAWFGGKTISPRTVTVNKVLRLYGKRLGVVDL